MIETARPPGPAGLSAAVASRAGGWRVFALYAAFLALALVPIAAFDVLPLADLPNHLARVHILDTLAHSTDLQKFYAIEWQVPSFQSPDFILPPLASWIGLFPAARLYVAVTFLLLVGGTCALHRSLFGRVGYWPLLSTLLLFNHLLAWGFVSYLFATGLVLLMFGGWIAGRHAANWLRLLVFVPATAFLFACHLFGMICYGILVGTYELWRLRSEPTDRRSAAWRLLIAALPFLPPAALLLHALDRSIPKVTFYGSVAEILRATFAPFAMYMSGLELATVAGALLAVVFYHRAHLLRFAPAMRLPAAILLVAALAMPVSLSSVWGANIRIPCLLAFLLVAAGDVELATPRRRTVFITAIALLLTVRVGLTLASWAPYVEETAEFRRAASVIEPGSRVLAIRTLTPDSHWRTPAIFPYDNIAAYAVIDRDVFLPHLFTLATPLVFIRDQRNLVANLREKDDRITWHPEAPAFLAADGQTVRQVDALGQAGRLDDSFLSVVDWSRWPEDFDYLIDCDFGRADNPVPALLTEVAQGSFFTIYRIHPPAANAGTP